MFETLHLQITNNKLLTGDPATKTVTLYEGSFTFTCQGENEELVGGQLNRNPKCPKYSLICPEFRTSNVCPNACSAMGKCVNGKCICLPGYIGNNCAIIAKPGQVAIYFSQIYSQGTTLNTEVNQDSTTTINAAVNSSNVSSFIAFITVWVLIHGLR